jgi:hypothetical protein
MENGIGFHLPQLTMPFLFPLVLQNERQRSDESNLNRRNQNFTVAAGLR